MLAQMGTKQNKWAAVAVAASLVGKTSLFEENFLKLQEAAAVGLGVR
jgi:hypothetical protein